MVLNIKTVVLYFEVGLGSCCLSRRTEESNLIEDIRCVKVQY